VFVGAGFFGWEGPAVALASGMERALRMSAAEAAMMDRRKKELEITCFSFFHV
jgi:hypothetical protein